MVRRIHIVTDSASDLTAEQIEVLKVRLASLTLLCGGDTYPDDKTLPTASLWERMARGDVLTTSQASPGSFLEIFGEAKAQGDAVVCVLLSSALSGTYQSAVMAKAMAEYEEIYLVDSRSATLGEKLLVLHACALRDRGRTGAEIAGELEALRGRVRLYACIDTLEYLVRGGRLSRAAGSIGSLLSIKPVLTIGGDGTIQVLRKVPGIRHAVRELRGLAEAQPWDEDYPVIPIYARDDGNCRKLLEQLGDTSGFLPPEEIGPVIGCHITPGGFGLVYIARAEQEA